MMCLCERCTTRTKETLTLGGVIMTNSETGTSLGLGVGLSVVIALGIQLGGALGI